jgi:hypothetical protein
MVPGTYPGYTVAFELTPPSFFNTTGLSTTKTWFYKTKTTNNKQQTTTTLQKMTDQYVEKISSDEQTEIDMGDLKLISACCCTVNGLYCPSFKECFGGHGKGAL